MNTINIAFCFDNNYALGYLVTMISLFENNKDEKIKVYVITPGLTDETKSKFNKLGDLYNQTIIYRDIDDRYFDGLPCHGHFNKATYFRYTIPDLCEESKVLQLDGDIIVRKSIANLWNTDVSDVAMAVIEDQCCDDVRLKNRLGLEDKVFNNGVQLMNLDYWRKNNIANKCRKFLIENPDICVYMDQDANNVVLHNEVKYLPYDYNFQEKWYLPVKELFMSREKWGELERFKDDPTIVHYCMTYKPWFTECTHPHADWFENYANKYTFIGYKKVRFHSFLYRIVNRFLLIKGQLWCQKIKR